MRQRSRDILCRYDRIDTDVVVIGSGVAGLIAALRAAETGADVTLISKSFPGRDNASALSQGSIAIPDADAEAALLDEALACSGGLGCQALRVKLIRDAANIPRLLMKYGVPLAVSGGLGRLQQDSRLDDETTNAAPGAQLTGSLVRAARQREVRFFKRTIALDLGLVRNSNRDARGAKMQQPLRCQGVLAYDFEDGRFLYYHARAVVLACGGAAALYERHDNAPGACGDGYALALRAGAALRDMEFVQFSPFSLLAAGEAEQSRLRTLPTDLVRHGRLINAKGDDLAARYAIPPEAPPWRYRVQVGRVMGYEGGYGNGAGSIRHRSVFVDLRALPQSVRHKHADLLANLPKWEEQPQALVARAHHCMGGVAIDVNGATGVPGLYAAGEVAGGVHGANRLAGSGLAEALIFGAAAGAAAAAEVNQQPRQSEPVAWLEERCAHFIDSYVVHPGGGNDISEVRGSLAGSLTEYAGLRRHAKGLRRALDDLDELRQQRLPTLRATFPLELAAIVELEHGLLAAAAIIRAALLREESRGWHCRSDFPEEETAWLRTLYLRQGEESGQGGWGLEAYDAGVDDPAWMSRDG